MVVVISNPPWIIDGRYGMRATGRWPHLRNDKRTLFPIFHAYAAAVLEEKGINVEVIDAVEEELSIEAFVDKLYKISPEYIFLEISYPSYEVDKKTISEIKKNIGTKICIFGPDASARPDFLLKDCKDIDIVIVGEFEYTIRDLSLKKKLNKTKGILYREGNEIIKTKPRELIKDLDELPLPSYHLYRYNSDLYQDTINYRPQFLVSTSRGCPFGCSFCVYPQTISGRKFRKRSARKIVDDIEILIKKYNAKVIDFDDDTFTVDMDRVKEMCNEIIRRKIKIIWQCYSSVNIQDFEMYKLMKKAGCAMVRFGVESASLSTQEHSGKNLTIEKIKKGFLLAKKAGMKTFGTFVFGLPGDTKESMHETIKLAIELNPYAVQFSYIVAYPGTRLFSEAEEKGWLIKGNQDGFAGGFKPSILPDGLKIEDIRDIVPLAYKKFYLRPNYIISKLIESKNKNDFVRLYYGFLSLFQRLVKN